jgi:putative DNA methylase
LNEELRYPKRLIEIDLPIKRVSAHARREKSIRHGHISTLHIWWARRPLAACRAVICAALWPDPGDPMCPPAFREKAHAEMLAWTSHERQRLLGPESRAVFEAARQKSALFDEPEQLRMALLNFIADFANWDNSGVAEYLNTSRALTQAAHEALGGTPGTRPLVVDPFAGGGSIPLEALRIGADAFASDLNPVAVLLNKVVLEYIPKYGETLASDVRKWGDWIKAKIETELSRFYPQDSDGAIPTAYLWARTVRCEGPDCGAEIPLLRSLWLVKKARRSVALRIEPDRLRKRIDFSILPSAKPSEVGKGTCSGGSATCPVCAYTTPVESVRIQLSAKRGGARDARLIAVVVNRRGDSGQSFRAPTQADLDAVQFAELELDRRAVECKDSLSLIPDGHINHLRGFFNIVLYGITEWGDIFSPRQALALATLVRLVRDLPTVHRNDAEDPRYTEALKTCLALVVDRVAVRCTANCIWDATTSCIMQVFNQGQSLPARWEFAEMSPTIDSGSGWATSIDYTIKVMEHVATITHEGRVQRASATAHPLPTDSAQAIITDPPYYAAIPYADLSDFFFSWLKRSLVGHHDDLLNADLTEKTRELVSLAHRAAMYREKDNQWFEEQMSLACAEARRVCEPAGLGVFVFANKETAAWEAMLASLINAGWVVTASWPIDTESGNRLRAKESAALVSSVHLVCRPRENPDGSVRADEVGDWREVLEQLPKRIHSWMPRLVEEGVVGADAIFACLGPALEIFSRYSRVEKASGDAVTLKEYLEHVWAAVAREALATVLQDSDSGSLEPDARLTVIWLWTLGVGNSANGDSADTDSSEAEGEEESTSNAAAGYVLEFDAARKIAQGLGANLEALGSVVMVKGDKARLLAVADRTQYLFGKMEGPATTKRAPKKKQISLFAEIEEVATEQGWGDVGAPKAGTTTLDRVHQAMLLFASARGEALKRFLVEEGIGRQAPFWKLSQALAALYPSGSDERRWIEGVLARKKGLGFG